MLLHTSSLLHCAAVEDSYTQAPSHRIHCVAPSCLQVSQVVTARPKQAQQAHSRVPLLVVVLVLVVVQQSDAIAAALLLVVVVVVVVHASTSSLACTCISTWCVCVCVCVRVFVCESADACVLHAEGTLVTGPAS